MACATVRNVSVDVSAMTDARIEEAHLAIENYLAICIGTEKLFHLVLLGLLKDSMLANHGSVEGLGLLIRRVDGILQLQLNVE